MKSLSKIFLAGMAATVPIAITIYILYWLGTSAEHFFGGMLKFIMPAAVYRPGMGVAIGVGVIFLVGLFMRAWIVRKVFSWAEGLLSRVPIKSPQGWPRRATSPCTCP